MPTFHTLKSVQPPPLARQVLSVSLFLLAALHLPAKAEIIPVSSKTQQVTAYQGLALVTRKIDLPKLSAGTHEILISDLTTGLVADSLSISGSGQAKIRVNHMELHPLEPQSDSLIPIGPLDEEDPLMELQREAEGYGIAASLAVPEQAELQRQIFVLQRKLSRISNQEELNATHKILAETLSQQLQARAHDPSNSMSAKEWQELVNLALTQNQQVLESRLSAQEQKQIISNQIYFLKTKLLEMQASIKPHQQASIFITVDTPGSATLMLSYLINNVNWQPAYEARLDLVRKKLHLVYQGDLQQRSGESWDKIQLSLSSITPALNSRTPQPQNWVIAKLPTEEERGAIVQVSSQTVPERNIRRVENVRYTQSRVQETGMSVRFQLPEAQSVPSSPLNHRLALTTREYNYETSYRIIPRQSPFAFLEVQIKNDSDLPLLPGVLRSYVGEEFTSSQPIDLVRPGEITRISFGADQDIKVSWKETSREQKVTGALGDQTELTLNYEAEITNYKPVSVDLKIQEPTLLSGDDKIRIELLKTEPAPSLVSEDKKLQTWQLKALPSETKRIKISYRLTYPKEIQTNL